MTHSLSLKLTLFSGGRGGSRGGRGGRGGAAGPKQAVIEPHRHEGDD